MRINAMRVEGYYPRDLWARPVIYAAYLLIAGLIYPWFDSPLYGVIALIAAPVLLVSDNIFRLYARSLRWFVPITGALFFMTSVIPFVLLAIFSTSGAVFAAHILNILGYVLCLLYYRWSLDDRILYEFEQATRLSKNDEY